MTTDSALSIDLLNKLSVYIDIQTNVYTDLAVLDSREDPPRLYVFLINEALREIESRGIRPCDGMVYLLKADSSFRFIREWREKWEKYHDNS